MPLMDMQEPDQADPSKELPTPSQDVYEFTVNISPKGIVVDGSEPLPDSTTALKHILAILKEHPISENPHDQLKAGYESP